MKWKLFGGKNQKTKRWITIPLIVLLVIECLYLLFIYSKWTPIARLRSMAIQTSMSTMYHQWVAKTFFPQSVIDEVMNPLEAARDEQVSLISHWVITDPNSSAQLSSDEERFFAQFSELDRNSVTAYLSAHPEALNGGWDSILVDKASLEEEGTDMRTTEGDQVLAIDAINGITLVRVQQNGWRGVLAIAHDPSRLSVQPSALIDSGYGQTAGEIAKAHSGVLALTASGFMDENGIGSGGAICGYAMCGGVVVSSAHCGYGYKRIELHEDNHLYILDVSSPVSSDCTDAVEFSPALIVDGKIVVDDTSIWTALNPRACIGQRSDGAIMMLSIEGRQITSIGTTVVECAEVLARYGCRQAINLDGGTSAILWYRGKPVTRCCNLALPEGRTLPNAFVYAGT